MGREEGPPRRKQLGYHHYKKMPERRGGKRGARSGKKGKKPLLISLDRKKT